jgi:DNA-binding NarL/FixJ family response regulator
MTTLPTPALVRVVSFDRHETVLAGVDAILRAEPGIVLVGSTEVRFGLRPLLRRTDPDILLLEYEPGGDGLELCLQVASEPGAPRVVLFGTVGGAEAALAARLAGATALVDKRVPARVLVAALRYAAAGQRLLPDVSPSAQARAGKRLDAGDRAIFAMRLADTPEAEIGAVVGMRGAQVRARLATIVTAVANTNGGTQHRRRLAA